MAFLAAHTRFTSDSSCWRRTVESLRGVWLSLASDILRTIPGSRVVDSSQGTTIVPTRRQSGQSGYCVNVFVDHAIWERDPGDLDRAFQVNEIAAIEAYAGDYVAQEFAVPAKNSATIVIWTKRKIDER